MGADEFIRAIDPFKKVRAARGVVKQNGAELTERMMKNANFKGHTKNGKFIPPTGATKRSISLRVGELRAEVGPSTEYAPYLEYGTRYMSAQPFVFVSLDQQVPIFLKELAEVLTE